MLSRATMADVREILDIANWAAEHTTANFATAPESLEEWTQSFLNSERRYPWLLYRRDGRLVGFAKASAYRARGAYAWCAETTVYVHPDFHGQGVGKALYEKLIALLKAQGYVTLVAGITVPNPASIKLHEGFGFTKSGVLPRVGWKYESWLDVGFWTLELQPPGAAPASLRSVDEVLREQPL